LYGYIWAYLLFATVVFSGHFFRIRFIARDLFASAFCVGLVPESIENQMSGGRGAHELIISNVARRNFCATSRSGGPVFTWKIFGDTLFTDRGGN